MSERFKRMSERRSELLSILRVDFKFILPIVSPCLAFLFLPHNEWKQQEIVASGIGLPTRLLARLLTRSLTQLTFPCGWPCPLRAQTHPYARSFPIWPESGPYS